MSRSPGHIASASPPLGARIGIALMVILALMQGTIFFFTGGVTNRSLGLAIGGAALVGAFWPRPWRFRVAILAMLTVAGAANFIDHVVAVDGPYSVRLLQASTGYGYAALLLAGIAALLGRAQSAGWLIAGASLAFGLAAADRAVQELWPGLDGWTARVVRWSGGTVPDPVLDERYLPRSEARTYYTSNPRGYFRDIEPRQRRWQLGVNHKGSAARLGFPDAAGAGKDAVRVEVERAEVPTGWHVQLAFKGLTIKAGDSSYAVAFQARAERPRAMSVSVGQGRPPWKALGLYTDVELGAEWRDYVLEFSPASSEDRAVLNFNLGTAIGAVEIRAVQVRMIRTGASAVGELPHEFAVDYRFNDQGCRGPDVPLAAQGRRRILLLGDSYTLGAGVHEEHTFAVRLQALLNASATGKGSGPAFEVVNCGVSGYDTTQEGKLFNVLGPVYRPDIVVLAMVGNDHLSWREEVARGYVHHPTKYEGLFVLWAAFQVLTHEGRRPPPEFSRNLAEIRALDERVRGLGARLVVVAFRNFPSEIPEWSALVRTMSAALPQAGIPWLDLGTEMLAGRSFESLFVHPGGDFHPNEIGHASAADQIARLLQSHGLVD